jgi:hypothetical protein
MKKSEFIKAVDLTTATSMPVFNTNEGVKCVAVGINDESVSSYDRSRAERQANTVLLRPIKFTQDEDGRMLVVFATASAIRKQINQVNLFAKDYTEAYAMIQLLATSASNARRARMEAQAKADAARHHNRLVCDELLPSIKETLYRFVDCHITKDYSNGDITINIPAAELENLVALLAHAEPQA